MAYETMTTEELIAESNRLETERMKVKDEMSKIQQVLSTRTTTENAEKKVALMSDAEKAAIVQAIGVSGIKSGAAVGMPNT